MQEEWDSLVENDTFKEVNGSNVGKPIGSKWVFQTKIGLNHSTKFKACLVIKGYEQVEGVDFDETYAPVSKLATLRLLLALSACNGWKLDHMDVKSAFLNPKIDRDNVFMQLPKGMDIVNPASKPTVVRLQKALYGPKQAPRLCYENPNSFLLSRRFGQSTADPNLYLMEESLILLNVDDLLIAHVKEKGGDKMKEELSRQYSMTDLGKAKRFLGLEI
jgi:hypothetical protein